MKCQHCSREATVHLAETVDGHRNEMHLCGACARGAGIVAPETLAPTLLDSIVDHLITRHVGELVGELARTSCPVCGLTYMDFRADGRLGCPFDYEAFQRGLPPLLRRAHGATRHVGKFPRRRDLEALDRLKIRAQLRDAVASEDYERAAHLRDKLRREDAVS